MPAREPFIIAEMSCNHLGSLDRALAIVDAAADSGADAVKLQTWSELSIDTRPLTSGPWAGRSLADLYRECRTPWEWYAPIFARCRERGIEGFTSVFDRAALDFLEEQHDCQRYKIASFEITDLPLIKAVAATGKPMIISTGMATYGEIVDAWHAARTSQWEPEITLLRCASAYPAPPSACNLTAMVDLDRERLACVSVGLSDHTLGSTAAIVATALGATVIEKHLTLSRADGGPDAGFSAEPAEFKAMVRACREAKEALGEVHYGPTESEQSSLQYRRSLWVVEDIPTGKEVTARNVRSLRPADGIPAKHMPEVIGRKVRAAVSRGTPLSWEMLT